MARLGVRPQTLYAYVSRGRIEARSDPADARRSLYSSADIERLARRRSGGRKAEAVAHEAIAWGEPVLESAVSTVSAGRLIYRGRDAVELATSASLEAVAALLWEADRTVFERTTPPAPMDAAVGRRRAVFAVLAERAARADPVLGRAAPRLHLEAAEIVHALSTAVCGVAAEPHEPIHARLARGWAASPGRSAGANDAVAGDLLRRALVLLADHELNASTFAARVAASTGASLAASTLAGLAALSGPLDGTAGLAVAALARDAARDGADAAVGSWIAQGRQAPGFGHPRLYPHGDPRAVALLETFEPPPIYCALQACVAERLGLEPNVDFALAAATERFALPPGAPFFLFALARSVGWIAHALEQAQTGQLIRPRARYVGERPRRG